MKSSLIVILIVVVVAVVGIVVWQSLEQTTDSSCAKEGESTQGTDNWLSCCVGLEKIYDEEAFYTDDNSDKCQLMPTPRDLICTYCGNDICGEGEDECNCPQDCEKAQYDMIYCSGHSDTVNEIKILDGEVIEPEREGHLALEAYDYQCYLLDTDNLTKEELTIPELNNLGLIMFKNSLDDLRIVREELESPEDVLEGLIFYKVFLANGSTKRLIYNEEYPVLIFRLIGWIVEQK